MSMSLGQMPATRSVLMVIGLAVALAVIGLLHASPAFWQILGALLFVSGLVDALRHELGR